MRWDDEWLAEKLDCTQRVNIKRRKVGRFIGLRSCETPIEEVEEYAKWKTRKEEAKIKGDDFAFWGRRGWMA